MASAAEEDVKLDRFLHWLQINGVQLRRCSIKRCGSSKGYGVFSSPSVGDESNSDGVLMVVPLDLAITPMRVLQDGMLGPRCAEMFKEGDVDDRFLVILFLTVERLRRNSPWKSYIDMLPRTFTSPLWFSEDELSELKGTSLYKATILQKKKLQALFDDKVKSLVQEILHDDGGSESGQGIQFEDFLWANSVFWTRALNIPFPHTYVFPSSDGDANSSSDTSNQKVPSSHTNDKTSIGSMDVKIKPIPAEGREMSNEESSWLNGETVWVEGLIPGIDFCNHGLEVSTTWEVDESGCVSGVPLSMYLVSEIQKLGDMEKEICISYGNKGNEELLYLYGFILQNNPDDYLMVHYPLDALQNAPFSDVKAQLLEMQKADLRCLLPRNLLGHGFTAGEDSKKLEEKVSVNYSGYSWSGQRKAPSYSCKLIFPEDFLASLRTISLQEHEISKVSALLNELTDSDEERQPSSDDVKAAVWEAAGDLGAFQLLVDLLYHRLMELEESSGTEESDLRLLERLSQSEDFEDPSCSGLEQHYKKMNMNAWSSIIYRRGQKFLAARFLKEAEYLLEMCSKDAS
ncbi:SET domain-containing protein isoform X2 [Wolffia australiana]